MNVCGWVWPLRGEGVWWEALLDLTPYNYRTGIAPQLDYGTGMLLHYQVKNTV